MRLPRKGRGYAPARGLVDQPGARRRLHGRRPVHLALRPAPARGPPAVRAPRRGHRLAARPGCPRRPRPQARADLALVQPAAQAHPAGPLQRRPVRLQGAASRRGGEAAPARRGQRMVLRHRAAGHGRAAGPAHRRGAGGLGGRSRFPGRHRDHRHRRPARRMAPAGAASQAGLRRAAPNDVAADQLLRFAGVGVVSTLGYLFLFIAWRPLLGAFGANARGLAIATLFNTAVHRELSHAPTGGPAAGRFVAVAGGLYVVSLALTTLGLWPSAPWSPPARCVPRARGRHRGQRWRRRLPLRRPASLDLPARRRTPATTPWRPL